MAAMQNKQIKVSAEIAKVTYVPGNESLKVELTVLNVPDNVQALTRMAESVIITGIATPEQTEIENS